MTTTTSQTLKAQAQNALTELSNAINSLKEKVGSDPNDAEAVDIADSLFETQFAVERCRTALNALLPTAEGGGNASSSLTTFRTVLDLVSDLHLMVREWAVAATEVIRAKLGDVKQLSTLETKLLLLQATVEQKAAHTVDVYFEEGEDQLATTTTIANRRAASETSANGGDTQYAGGGPSPLRRNASHQGKEFWKANFGEAAAVSLEAFEQALARRAEAKRVNVNLRSLRATLDPSRSGWVSAYKFNSFLKAFAGGIANGGESGKREDEDSEDDDAILDACESVARVASHEWFAGFISAREANNILMHAPVGSFLVRFSKHCACGFSIDVVSPEPKPFPDNVLHYIVVVGWEGYTLKDPAAGRAVARRSLMEVVQSRPDLFRFPAPGVKDVARARFFRGFWTGEEARAKLAGEPDGTFLFRFSQREPGCLVVSYKQAGKVAHTYVRCTPAGYVLEGAKRERVFRSVDEIVEAYKYRLRYPYLGTEGNSGRGEEEEEEGEGEEDDGEGGEGGRDRDDATAARRHDIFGMLTLYPSLPVEENGMRVDGTQRRIYDSMEM